MGSRFLHRMASLAMLCLAVWSAAGTSHAWAADTGSEAATPAAAKVMHDAYENLHRAGNREAALEYLHAAVEAAPHRTEWLIELGEAYEASGRLKDALSVYREAQSRGIQADLDKRIGYLEATLKAKQGHIKEARQAFFRLVERYPNDALLVYSLGVANLLSRRLQDAERDFTRVIELDPTYANAYLNLATVYERQGKLSAAVDILQKLTRAGAEEAASQQAEVRLGLIEARLLLEEGNLHEALDLVTDLLQVVPDNPAVLAIAADIQQGLGDLQAEEALRRHLLRLQPGNPVLMMRLAEIYIADNRLREAYDMLEAIKKESRGSRFVREAEQVEASLFSGSQGKELASRLEDERLAEALESLNKDPDDFDALWDLSRIHVRRGHYKQALSYLERVMTLRPGFEEGRVLLASLYDQLGMFDHATEAYARAVAQATDEQSANALVAQLLLVNAKRLFVARRLDEAVEAFESVLARDPDNALAHFYLGLIHSSRQDLIKAAEEYQNVLRLVPSHVGARLNLANSYERMNREEDAIEEYRKILQSKPSQELAEDVRTRLRSTERRINGLVASLGYVMSYDDNTNLSDKQSVDDYRSNLTLSLAYQHKLDNGIRLRLSTTPTYEVYHEGEFDFLNTSSTFSATYIPRGITLVGGYTYRTSMGLVTSNRFSRSNVYFAQAFSRVRLPSIMKPFSGKRVFSGLSGNLSYTDFEADDSPFFSAYTTVGSISVSQPLKEGVGLTLGYSFVDNENKEFIGSDYAYRSHGVSGSIDWGLPSGVVLNLGAQFTRLNYKNKDSFSRFTKRRRNDQFNATLGASYRLRRDITLFSNLSWTHNDSNLPVGFILNPEDIVEGQQSSSLSDYSRLVVSTGINVSF